MTEYLDRAKLLSVMDGLIAAREKCKNCGIRQTVEYNMCIYLKRIIEAMPVALTAEDEAQEK